MFNHREYQRLWIANRRAVWFEDKYCVKCGSKEDLEIHHVDPSTKVSNSVWSWAQERRDAELDKCEVLCHGCHKVETLLQKAKPIEHGTYVGYMHHGCRCMSCIEAASGVRNKQRRTKGRKHQKSYNAVVAQRAEQGSCKPQVGSANLFSSSKCVNAGMVYTAVP